MNESNFKKLERLFSIGLVVCGVVFNEWILIGIGLAYFINLI